MPLRTPQATPEQREDATVYTKGVYSFELRHHVRKIVTFGAYIKGIGIVEITNDTFDRDFKMKIGNSLKLIPDEPIIFVRAEDFPNLGIPEQQAKKRNPDSIKPIIPAPEVSDIQNESAAEVTGIYNKVSGKMVEEALEKAPDSSENTG